MKCDHCFSESEMLFTLIDSLTKEKKSVCAQCISFVSPKNTSLSEIDDLIKESEKLGANVERLEKEIGGFNDDDENVPANAFTPKKLFNFSSALIDSYKKTKESILNNLSEYERLTYFLQQALENEDYEKAAIYRDKINQLETK